MKHGKKYNAAAAKYDLSKKYDVASACKMVQDMKFANFDETVEAHISVRLEKNATVRDTLVFPNQFRGEKKVLVFCKEDKVKEALDAGAAFAGSDEYIEKVKGGWLDFDVHRRGTTEIVDAQDADNQEGRASHQHQRQFHGRVLLMTRAPDANQQIHRNQRHLVEHEHREQVGRDEEAEHTR